MPPLAARRKDRGFVLVMVLGMLVLIVVLVIGFLGHVSSQSKSSSSYRDQTGTLLLSDLAVNIVKGQINTATTATTPASVNDPGGIWASQPGAIRVQNAAGTQTTYKLYSSSALTSTSTGTALKTTILGDIPTASDANNWENSALWTDLNAPVIKSDNSYAYPIIDVKNDPDDLPLGGTSAAPFISGSFNIDSTAAANPIGATRSPNGNTPLPMPVRWLYVLKQGQIIAPDATSTPTQLTFNSAPTKPVSTPNDAATDNPIIGRIAFWTDDDTCRVNINTASHGTFWDTPRFTSADDLLLSLNQPVSKEYQRYPGHVAMTTLALALPELASKPEAILALSPRYYPGGSTEGTVASNQNTEALGATAKTNRLYASVNELLFDPPPTGAGARTASPHLSKKQVETAKFFLTAHSRAPELNLFGLPRVAMWPISSLTNTTSASYRTVTDELIAFCSTTPSTTIPSPNTYYFTRAPHTTTLTNGGYVPGLVGSNSSTADVSLARNTQLLSYLDRLTGIVLPGNLSGTATFDSKYTQLGMRQILTEIFDYVRITNARDPLLDNVSGLKFSPSNDVSKNVPYAAINAISATNNTFADGQVLPTVYTWPSTSPPQLTYGFGRFNGRLVEATLVFVGVGNSSNAVQANQAATDRATPTYTVSNPGLLPPAGNTAVQAMFALSFFDPALGYTLSVPSFSITVSGTGLSNLALNGTSLKFPGTASFALNGNGNYGGRPSNAGSIKPFPNMVGSAIFKSGSGGYPFYSNIINIPNSTGLMTLSGGGTITINVYPLPANASPSPAVTPIHTYTLNLASLNGLIPVPGYSKRPLFGSSRTIPSTRLQAWTTGSPYPDRFDCFAINYVQDGNQEFISNVLDTFNDTVISLVPAATYGDYRMLAPFSTAISGSSPSNPLLDGTAFVAHPNFGHTTANRLAYGMEYPGGQTGRGSSQGTLVSGASYFTGTPSGVNPGASSAIPLVPATVSNPVASGTGTTSPDFDNGYGPVPDGPYINKPDEGMIFPISTGYRSYYDNINPGANTYFKSFASPERQVPSPVMFGSLPTGAPVGNLPAKPWQTLLFQPGAAGHVGLNAPKDDYLLDLFWMPQAEPYAISEPFSTAGKINLNYQILPFTYIHRSTGIQSVLASEKVAMVPSSDAANYKHQSDTSGTSVFTETNQLRSTLNMSESDGTLRPFHEKFKNFDFFKAAAEICDVYLVPQGQSWSSDTAAQAAFYGSGFGLVGDNTRERPYANIYSRITTKSNSYTVYYRVQTLKNGPGAANAAQWTEGQGTVVGDYRGSTSLERYIDPNDKAIPDYATTPDAANLESHYKWRVVNNSRFSP